jgi:hypothetical protein
VDVSHAYATAGVSQRQRRSRRRRRGRRWWRTKRGQLCLYGWRQREIMKLARKIAFRRMTGCSCVGKSLEVYEKDRERETARQRDRDRGPENQREADRKSRWKCMRKTETERKRDSETERQRQSA